MVAGNSVLSRSSTTFDRIAWFAFILGLSALLFLMGYQVRSKRAWPTPVLEQAKSAVVALQTWVFGEGVSFHPVDHERQGVTRHEPELMAPGMTLMTKALPDRFVAQLVDAEGEIRHEWHKTFAEVWPDGAPHIIVEGNPAEVKWHGVWLYPDGSLLASFEGAHFPHGGGLIKLGPGSDLVWKVERNTHHDVEVLPDGRILALSMRYSTEQPKGLPRLADGFDEDMVLILSPEGEVEFEASIMAALRGRPGLALWSREEADPTHANDVDLITPELAAGSPMLHAGDLMVSARSLNTILFIDPTTGLVRNSLGGIFVAQHDPEILPNGNLLVFDNRGGPPDCGGSRIVEIDLLRKVPVWQFDGCGIGGFRSDAWGSLDILPNGNLLIAESYGGRVLEITHEPKPRIVWEYYHHVGDIGGQPHVGLIGEAKRIPPERLGFLAATS